MSLCHEDKLERFIEKIWVASVIGFDIGNLQSKIGLARNRGIDIIVNETSNRATPSLVSFGPQTRSIGEAAKTQETSNYKNTVGSLKRLIGRSINDPDIANYERKYINADLIDINGSVGVQVQYLGEPTPFSATQLYAMYLAKLRDIAFNESKAPVNNIVIAVPGWYTDAQRRAVLDAAEVAGLNALKLINEGAAIAFGYGITKQDLPAPEEKPRIVAFVDIGHSSYSVTIAAFNKTGVTIKAAAHDRHFGGRDIDFALVEHFATEFKTKYKIDVMSNKKAIFRLLVAVEKLKKILSANNQAPLSVESIMNDIDASSSMTREAFEGLVQDLLDRATIPLETALAQSGLSKEDIDNVELIGGSTRIPALKSRIQDFFGRAPFTTLNQDEAVARGATLACATLSPIFRVRDFSIADVASYPITVTWERVPEDDDVSLDLYKAGNNFPSTKILTLQRSSNFDLEAVYPSDANLPGSSTSWVSRITVKDVRSPDERPAVVKIKCRLNQHGIFTFESAILHETMDSTEPETAAPAPDGSATPMDVDEKARSKKTVTKRELPIIVMSTSLDRPELEELRGKEGEMHASDRLVAETQDRKNALEEYIYDMREKVDTSLAAFETSETRQKLKAELDTAESWLYSEEGEEGTKSAFVAKLEALRVIGAPIVVRYKEAEERPAVVRKMKETLSKYRNKATAGEERYSHISQDEINKVLQKVATEEKWLDDQTARQAERPKSQNPIVLSAEIAKRREELSYILNKAKPAGQTTQQSAPSTSQEAESAAKADARAEEAVPVQESETMEVD